jgi:hypothetical protein
MKRPAKIIHRVDNWLFEASSKPAVEPDASSARSAGVDGRKTAALRGFDAEQAVWAENAAGLTPVAAQ